jgi:hypothetical protein
MDKLYPPVISMHCTCQWNHPRLYTQEGAKYLGDGVSTTLEALSEISVLSFSIESCFISIHTRFVTRGLITRRISLMATWLTLEHPNS